MPLMQNKGRERLPNSLINATFFPKGHMAIVMPYNGLRCNKLVPKRAGQLAHYLIFGLRGNLLGVLPNPGRSLGAHD